MFEYILLDSIMRLNGERTVYNVFHLLTAKKSTQTIQDSNLFGLTNYFGIFLSLRRTEFNRVIQQFIDQDIISLDVEKQTASITNQGQAYYQELKKKHGPFLYLDGSIYQRTAERFSKHLLLFVQTLTHLHVKDHRFIPIIEDIETQRFVKKLWYMEQKKGTEKLLDDIYHDLNSILKDFPDRHAGIFVDSLTTKRKIGLSRYQVARKYNVTPLDVFLIFSNIIHAICRAIDSGKHFHFLPQLYVAQKQKPLLSNSANQTFYYMEQGLSIEEIASLRHLKLNTIMDHIVEIAYINKSFDWSIYITKQQYELIKAAINKIQSKKLKEIKHYLPDSISYFHIKLVMALDHSENMGEHDYV